MEQDEELVKKAVEIQHALYPKIEKRKTEGVGIRFI